MDGVVVIGEGEKDEAPMLFNGESIGDGSPPAVDIAVDPLEGTTLTAKGQPNALCVVALSERGTMFDPGPCVYMEKMAGGSDIADLLSLPTRSRTCSTASRAAPRQRRRPDGRDPRPPRHTERIERVRSHGGRIRLIPDGDVAGSLMAVWPDTGIDLLWGIGGTPEGVLGRRDQGDRGALLGRMAPRDDDERARTIARASIPTGSRQ